MDGSYQIQNKGKIKNLKFYVQYLFMNLLYVCKNNLFRSPVAEIITKKKAKDINVDSAGFDPYNASRSRYFFEALKKLEYDWKFVKDKKPKKITRDLLEDQDLILCMETKQKETLREMTKNKTYTLPEYAGFPGEEIPGPLLYFLGEGIAVEGFTYRIDENGKAHPLKVLWDDDEKIEIWIKFIKEIERYVDLSVDKIRKDFDL